MGQFVFPAKAREVYIFLKALRGIIVDPSSPALSNLWCAAIYRALGAILFNHCGDRLR